MSTMQGYSSPKVGLGTGEQGACVIATAPIMPGEVLFELTGTLESRPARHTLQVGRDVHLASSEALWRFLNHACAPNTRLELGVGEGLIGRVLARTPIAQGQELTLNYVTTEWDMATPFRCACGAPSCLGWVSGAKHLGDAQLAVLAPELMPHIVELLQCRVSVPLMSSTGSSSVSSDET
jgi:hypothetical protein